MANPEYTNHDGTQIIQGDYSTYNEYHITNNVGKEIPRTLGQVAVPDLADHLFKGRGEEFWAIHEKLNPQAEQENHALLLVNSEGGIGKTTLAAKYYHKSTGFYAHRIWVAAGTDLKSALLQEVGRSGLGLEFPEQQPELHFDLLLRELHQLKNPCLLVIDNAETDPKAEALYPALTGLTQFRVLITSRKPKFMRADVLPIGRLLLPQARALFVEYFPQHRAEDDEILEKVYEAVGGNTLVLEVLAKNLEHWVQTRNNAYRLADLYSDLQQKGFLRVKSKKDIDAVQWREIQGKQAHEILSAMYEFSELGDAERALLSVFAALPPNSPVPFEDIEFLLTLPQESSENQAPALEETLEELLEKGWISQEQGIDSFKVSPVVQTLTQEKNRERLLGDCQNMIDKLIFVFDSGQNGFLVSQDYGTAQQLLPYTQSLLEVVGEVQYDLARLTGELGTFFLNHTGQLQSALYYFKKSAMQMEELCVAFPNNVGFIRGLVISYEGLGNIYSSLGTLDKALQFFGEYRRLVCELHKAFPNQADFKRGLAVSYEKLGKTHSSLGDFEKALQFFEDETELFEELHKDFPDHVGFKQGLAISYEKLGETHSRLGDFEKALQFFEDETESFEELHKDFPDHVGFKQGLAISYERLGDTHSRLDDFEKALRFFEDETELFEALHKDFPDHVGFKQGLAISYYKLFTVKEKPEGKPYLHKALTMFEELVRDYPDHAEFRQHRNFMKKTWEEHYGA